ncbi:RNA polymerase sigma factor [Micromonospora sp. NPDC051141]|uniref:RNA polymerase sigma factor n=1 Tax=Micromonospora sp. NPDC051141 TaxID=3364284 RepID=UPI00378AE270
MENEMRATHDYTAPTAQRFRAGDETALTELYRHHAGSMFATALSLLGDRELAAEAVQQAFVQAWRSAGRIDATRDLGQWLYTLTRRAVDDVHRRSRRMPMHAAPDESRTMGSRVATEEPSTETMGRVWQVREALDRLDADERLVLQLAHHQGMTQGEIADALGIPLDMVKSRTSRAQRNLAAALLSHLPDTPVA